MDFKEKVSLCKQIEKSDLKTLNEIYDLIKKENPSIQITKSKKGVLLNFNKIKNGTIKKITEILSSHIPVEPEKEKHDVQETDTIFRKNNVKKNFIPEDSYILKTMINIINRINPLEWMKKPVEEEEVVKKRTIRKKEKYVPKELSDIDSSSIEEYLATYDREIEGSEYSASESSVSDNSSEYSTDTYSDTEYSDSSMSDMSDMSELSDTDSDTSSSSDISDNSDLHVST